MQAVYVGSFIFNQLESLKLCIGTDYASNLLVRLLEGSPNLRVLHLFEMVVRFFDKYSVWFNMHNVGS